MENQENPFDEGMVMLVDKPYGWTSFKAVKAIKRITKARKVGHAGTLDPLATGLLIICTGKFTKKLQEFQALPKIYSGTFTLGAVTDSFDLESEVKDSVSIDHIDIQQVITAAQSFLGDHSQIPPIFSAIKVDGKRAYESARKGEEIKLESRLVHIHGFDVFDYQAPNVHFRITCSKGTYIRAIARDLGQALGVGAHLSSLRREAIGDHLVSDAREPMAWAEHLTNEANL